MEGHPIDMNFEAFKFLNDFIEKFLRAQRLAAPQYTLPAIELIHGSSRELAPLMKQQFIPRPSDEGDPQ